jgi:uncharacterized protein (TIGR01777 family)
VRVLIAGSSGLIGTALVAALRADGHQVDRLVRCAAAAPDEYRWSPPRGFIDSQALPGADAVVNLCGRNIGNRRWTGAFKQELRDSRIIPTDVLSRAAGQAGVPLLINASGINYYGATGDHAVTESSPAGNGFLAHLCADWEAATQVAAEAGVRVVLLRSGLVLSRHGGLLGKLRPMYRLGLGGRYGDGRQYLPWISLDDEIGAIRFALVRADIAGPVNLVGPAPVTNAQFSNALGHALHRPARLPVPAVALRLLAGEFADEGLLTGPRAVPEVLEKAGYSFHHNTIGAALAAAVN